MPRIVKRPACKRDLVRHFAFIAGDSVEAARRFLRAAQNSFEALASMPKMGTPGKFPGGKLDDLRLWRVKGFENYLILYRSRRGGIAIERVIHAKQDYQRIM
jgi:plasmid stabilization system protein ParE